MDKIFGPGEFSALAISKALEVCMCVCGVCMVCVWCVCVLFEYM